MDKTNKYNDLMNLYAQPVNIITSFSDQLNEMNKTAKPIKKYYNKSKKTEKDQLVDKMDILQKLQSIGITNHNLNSDYEQMEFEYDFYLKFSQQAQHRVQKNKKK